ncbi:MAG: hypothetical protein FJX47_06010 [Alphaproteobacteria bacterium]|nr:hypothetical protein [Alphaproteobacteria bacterium]
MSHRFAAALRLARGAWTPFLDPYWDGEDLAVIDRYVAGDRLESEVSALSKALGDGLGPDYRVRLVGSGRAAIRLALDVAALPPGSEVALPAFSCAGVIDPVIAAGHRPVLVDCDDHFNIAMASLAAAESPSLKAVILPHLGGVFARDGVAIAEWARARGVLVIEDAAQSFGLSWNGLAMGALGDLTVFSSGLGKPLFGPGGGWVASRHSDLVRRLTDAKLAEGDEAALRVHLAAFVGRYRVGRLVRGWRLLSLAAASRIGSEAPGDTGADDTAPRSIMGIEAALARRQLAKWPEIATRRRGHAGRWRELLTKVGFATLRLPPEDGNVFVKFWASFAGQGAAGEAARLKSALWRSGVETEPLYRPLHLRAPYAGCRRVDLGRTEALWSTVYSLPVRPNLATTDWHRITHALGTLTGR